MTGDVCLIRFTDGTWSRGGTRCSHSTIFSLFLRAAMASRRPVGASLGVDLPAHLKAAADCAGGSAVFMRRPAQWQVLRRLSVRVAVASTCAISAVRAFERCRDVCHSVEYFVLSIAIHDFQSTTVARSCQNASHLQRMRAQCMTRYVIHGALRMRILF